MIRSQSLSEPVALAYDLHTCCLVLGFAPLLGETGRWRGLELDIFLPLGLIGFGESQ